MQLSTNTEQKILSVSDLNQAARDQLESGLGWVSVRGEISNLVMAQSGHVYFSLKDPGAQCRCVYFKRSHQSNISLANGQQIVISGRVSLYTPRGDFQVIVSLIQDDGEGKLALAFERNKKSLQKAGLFDPESKKSFPTLPNHLGVITSPTGAALQDILSVLKQRFPSVPVRIYPCVVQGDTAAPTIIAALQATEQENCCDGLIIARGGGSLEDLWPFNETDVAHAVFQCPIPIISGVGHETDTTICDLVADLRAATPSNAAELAVPNSQHWLERLARQQQALNQACLRQLQYYQQQLLTREKQLRSPQQRIQEQQQNLDHYQARLNASMRAILKQAKQQLEQRKQHINSLNPKRLLEKGYAIISDESGKTISSVTTLAADQSLTITLSDGQARTRVESVESTDSE